MQQHGHFDLWVENNVVIAKIAGQWNLETAKNYQASWLNNCERFNHDWGHLVYLDDWELGTPDIEPIIQEIVTWSIDHGLKRAAQVYHPSALKALQLDTMVQELPGGFSKKVFDGESQALAWLAEAGFHTLRS